MNGIANHQLFVLSPHEVCRQEDWTLRTTFSFEYNLLVLVKYCWVSNQKQGLI